MVADGSTLTAVVECVIVRTGCIYVPSIYLFVPTPMIPIAQGQSVSVSLRWWWTTLPSRSPSFPLVNLTPFFCQKKRRITEGERERERFSEVDGRGQKEPILGHWSNGHPKSATPPRTVRRLLLQPGITTATSASVLVDCLHNYDMLAHIFFCISHRETSSSVKGEGGSVLREKLQTETNHWPCAQSRSISVRADVQTYTCSLSFSHLSPPCLMSYFCFLLPYSLQWWYWACSDLSLLNITTLLQHRNEGRVSHH